MKQLTDSNIVTKVQMFVIGWEKVPEIFFFSIFINLAAT